MWDAADAQLCGSGALALWCGCARQPQELRCRSARSGLTGEEKVQKSTAQSPKPCGPANLSWALPGQRSSNLLLMCLKDCARSFLG